MTERNEARDIDMSAAKLAVRSVALLNLAVSTAGLTQQELAERLGVSAGRVSQVLNGDGNVRVSTLGRFLRAAGYDPQLDATPAVPSVLPLPKRKPRRRVGASGNHYRYMVVQPSLVGTAGGVEEQDVVQFSRCHPDDILAPIGPGTVQDLDKHTTFQLAEVVQEPALRTGEVPLAGKAMHNYV